MAEPSVTASLSGPRSLSFFFLSKKGISQENISGLLKNK